MILWWQFNHNPSIIMCCICMDRKRGHTLFAKGGQFCGSKCKGNGLTIGGYQGTSLWYWEDLLYIDARIQYENKSRILHKSGNQWVLFCFTDNRRQWCFKRDGATSVYPPIAILILQLSGSLLWQCTHQTSHHQGICKYLSIQNIVFTFLLISASCPGKCQILSFITYTEVICFLLEQFRRMPLSPPPPFTIHHTLFVTHTDGLGHHELCPLRRAIPLHGCVPLSEDVCLAGSHWSTCIEEHHSSKSVTDYFVNV